MGLSFRTSRDKIIWTRADQLEAISRGLFVASFKWTENIETERYVFVPHCIKYNAIPMSSLNVQRNSANTQRPHRATLTKVERRIALEAFRCDPFFEKMQAFILQQRQHGWAGAWEHNCGSARSMRLYILKSFSLARAKIGDARKRHRSPTYAQTLVRMKARQ